MDFKKERHRDSHFKHSEQNRKLYTEQGALHESFSRHTSGIRFHKNNTHKTGPTKTWMSQGYGRVVPRTNNTQQSAHSI